jgi:hypothetical protein
MLACCGAIIPERETGREPVEAIRIAQGLGMPLKIAAMVDPFDEGDLREVVEPLLAPLRTDAIEGLADATETASIWRL